MADYILYEVSDAIATITLDRPDRRNAQNAQLLNELNDAWERAAADDAVRVILLQANGPHFSAGHDTSHGANEGNAEIAKVGAGIKQTGTLGLYNWEAKHFLGYSRRWREIPKPSIAAVQGACIAGGLMLAWPCDLIVAADYARFSDPVVLMGIGGVEYHGHTWELGARRAKDMLFTGRAFTAQEAYAMGLVREVVPRDQLWNSAAELAATIAKHNPFGDRKSVV